MEWLPVSYQAVKFTEELKYNVKKKLLAMGILELITVINRLYN